MGHGVEGCRVFGTAPSLFLGVAALGHVPQNGEGGPTPEEGRSHGRGFYHPDFAIRAFDSVKEHSRNGFAAFPGRHVIPDNRAVFGNDEVVQRKTRHLGLIGEAVQCQERTVHQNPPAPDVYHDRVGHVVESRLVVGLVTSDCLPQRPSLCQSGLQLADPLPQSGQLRLNVRCCRHVFCHIKLAAYCVPVHFVPEG